MKCVKYVYDLAEGRRRVVFSDGTTTSYARLIAAIKLRRPLTDAEQVHHRNQDSLDDRMENLEIFASAADHGRWHGRHPGNGKTYGPKAFNLRLASAKLKASLEESAVKNHRSLNQEIVVRLERSLREDAAPRQHL